MDVKTASEKWGITTRRVRILCNDGRIDGAIRNGWSWIIPLDTPKPRDGRVLRRYKSLDIRLTSIDNDELDRLKKKLPLLSYFNAPSYNNMLSRTISFLFTMENNYTSQEEIKGVLNGEVVYSLSLEEHLIIVNFTSLLREYGERKTKLDLGEIKRLYSSLMRGIEFTDGSFRDSSIVRNGERVSISDSMESVMNQYDQSWSNLNGIISAIILSGEIFRSRPYTKHLAFFIYLVFASELFRNGYIPPSFSSTNANEIKADLALISTKGVYLDMISLIERVMKSTYGDFIKDV